jgi:hypothetical protein
VVASLLVATVHTSVSAFVIRNPDENHAEVYRWLLRRNLRMPLLAYAVDASGDVYVRGQVPTAGGRRGAARPAARGSCWRPQTSRSTSCSSWASSPR